MTARPASGVRRGGARPVGARLDQALSGFGIPPVSLLMRVTAAWSEAIGAAGQRCCLEGISGDVLHVVAADSASASELKWDTPRIVAAVNDAAGEQVAQTLRVRVGAAGDDTAAAART